MNSSQLSRKLVRLWVVANLCSLVAVYGSLAPQIASLAETLGVTAMLVWDALPLFAMVWLLRPRAQNALPNHPLQLIILAFARGGPAWSSSRSVAGRVRWSALLWRLCRCISGWACWWRFSCAGSSHRKRPFSDAGRQDSDEISLLHTGRSRRMSGDFVMLPIFPSPGVYAWGRGAL